MKTTIIAALSLLAFGAAEARDTVIRDSRGQVKYRISECVGGKKTVRDGHGRVVEKMPCEAPRVSR